ncbi:hypothetical protein [Acinetobacter baumannii]|uniref:hypothetical protein n=1 Tax=Acinetobacter baumannii TaxID=470 RepID=UPI00148EF7C3
MQTQHVSTVDVPRYGSVEVEGKAKVKEKKKGKKEKKEGELLGCTFEKVHPTTVQL